MSLYNTVNGFSFLFVFLFDFESMYIKIGESATKESFKIEDQQQERA